MASTKNLVERLNTLKSDIEEQKERASKASGALEQLQRQAKEEHDCRSLKEIDSKIQKLEDKNREVGDTIEEKLQDYEDEFKDVIDESEES